MFLSNCSDQVRAHEDVPRRRLSSLLALVLAMLATLLPAVGLTVAAASPASAAPPCPCTLWSASTIPTTVDSHDAHAVEVGVQFSSDTSGYISGVRFYKAAANTGIHIGSLWTSDGTLLAQATFSDESASGWQQVNFSTAVAVTAGTTYVAGYHTNTGHYSEDEGYFTSNSYTNAPLTAPGGNPATPNGLYAYSATPTFPTGTFNGTNYWVDVVYTSTAPPPLPGATSLWGPDTTPGTIDSNDPQAVEVGVQFRSATPGFISGVRFYKAATNTGTHIGSLWTAGGTLLAQATFSNESGSGWQQVAFSSPVAIAAGATYVAGYHTDTGHYSADEGYFSTGDYTNSPLTAPGGNPADPNGLYAYSATPTFPAGTFNGSNYWVDVVYTPTPIPVSIQVSAPQTTIPRGASVPLTAVESFSDGTSKDVTSTAAWSSSSPSVLTVAAGGTAQGVATGSATASASIDGLTGSVGITVAAPVSFMVINPPFVFLRVGQSTQLTVTAYLTDRSRLNVTALVKWSSSCSTATTISSTGLLTANRYGFSPITATLGRSTTYGFVVVS
jgi:hypothetical protein